MNGNGQADWLWPGWPWVSEKEAGEWLALPYPVWLSSAEGVITAANLMTLWLWRAVRADEQGVAPQLVLSVSVFDLVARDIERIPVAENEVFFQKTAWQAKRLAQQLGRAGRSVIASFEAALRSRPGLREMYDLILFDEAHESTGREWEYPLRIEAPNRTEEPSNLLHFKTHWAVVGQGKRSVGLIARYRPCGATTRVIRHQHQRLTRQYATIPYVLSAQTKGGETAIKEQEHQVPGNQVVEVMFDDPGKYVEFVKYVYDNLGRGELDFPHAPIGTAVRIRASALERVPAPLVAASHPVTQEDIDQRIRASKGRSLFDLRDLADSLEAVRPHVQRLKNQ